MDGPASLATAFWAAALALSARIVQDSVSRFRERRALAIAIAGEISAYLDLLQPEILITALQTLARADPATRKQRQRVFGPLPAGHPVFDQVGDRIGILPAELVLDISRFYNIITGSRLIMARFSSDEFSALDDAAQVAQITFLAETIERELPRAGDLTQALLSVSREWFFHP